MRERIFQPLGLEAAGALPEEALLWGAATGHITVPGAPEPIVAPQWGLTRNAGPPDSSTPRPATCSRSPGCTSPMGWRRMAPASCLELERRIADNIRHGPALEIDYRRPGSADPASGRQGQVREPAPRGGSGRDRGGPPYATGRVYD